jgi:hypothetical protein
MIVNNTFKFIFVHVPKAAGSSVTAYLSRLSRYCDLEVGATFLGEAVQAEYIRRFGLAKHSSAMEIRDVVGDEVWKGYFTFGFVRNPYERAFSIFNFMKKMANEEHQAYAEIKKFKTFAEFVSSEYFHTEGPDRILNPQLFWLGKGESSVQPAVQFVGSVADMNDSMSFIRRRIGGAGDVKWEDVPKINVSGDGKRSVWDEMQEHPQLEEIIFRRHGADFHAFGFRRMESVEGANEIAPTVRAEGTPRTSAAPSQRSANGPVEARPLFVCGCPQSGTRAISDWLSASERVVLGQQRYRQYWRRHLSLPEQALSHQRFFELRPQDTWYESLDQFKGHYEAARERWPRALCVGDEIPELWKNLAYISASHPSAKVLYSYRDPFSVALQWKARASGRIHPDSDPCGDTYHAILEWNDSVRSVIEFINNQWRKAEPSSACFVLDFGEWVSNCFDRYGLESFLGEGIDLPQLTMNSPREIGEEPMALSSVEREIVCSVADMSLHREIQRVIGKQKTLFSAARWKAEGPKRQQWYHFSDRRDADIDYGEHQIPGCCYAFRGRGTPLEPGEPYAACIGSATTFGRFLKSPYPAQLEAYTGIPFLNLGIGGGRPESYLIEATLLESLRNASLVVMEVMSARGYASPIYQPANPMSNLGYFKDFFQLERISGARTEVEKLLKKAHAKEKSFVERIYESVVLHMTSAQKALVREAVLNAYFRDWTYLMEAIGKPIIVLFMSRRAAGQAYSPSEATTLEQWAGDYPHFLDEAFLECLRQRGVPVVVSRSHRGLPFVVRNWQSGQPAPVFPWQADPTLNHYYPSQEMHDDAFRALVQQPLIGELRGRGREIAVDTSLRQGPESLNVAS